MPLYFQKISAEKFNAETSFIVKESKSMHLFISLAALAIALLLISTSIIAAILPGIFAVVSFIRSRKDEVVITINRTGFYYYGKLVTTWNNFVSAELVDSVATRSGSAAGFSDQFFIIMRYRKDGQAACFERKFRLTNTQNKSEEEILAAIKFYYSDSNSGARPSVE